MRFHTSEAVQGVHLHDSIVVSIPACHAGDRGSIPRRGAYFNRGLFPAALPVSFFYASGIIVFLEF